MNNKIDYPEFSEHLNFKVSRFDSRYSFLFHINSNNKNEIINCPLNHMLTF